MNVAKIVRDSRKAQGLTAKVHDREALRAVARLLARKAASRAER
jgi:hypothetical protein